MAEEVLWCRANRACWKCAPWSLWETHILCTGQYFPWATLSPNHLRGMPGGAMRWWGLLAIVFCGAGHWGSSQLGSSWRSLLCCRDWTLGKPRTLQKLEAGDTQLSDWESRHASGAAEQAHRNQEETLFSAVSLQCPLSLTSSPLAKEENMYI